MMLRALTGALLLSGSLAFPTDQQPLLSLVPEETNRHLAGFANSGRGLHGRFLHITDFHPDPFYKIGASQDEACHRGKGDAGFYGAENTDCDSPFSLINATFQWIHDNLKDDIDFIIWTGDSARHDSDDEIPRTRDQIVGLNQMLVDKFVEVFGDDKHPTKDLQVPIIPTFGNNDMMPHNIFFQGPNTWTKEFSTIWERFIPEEQRHAFQRGGWFYVEVIPKQLAVFSLNTMYFFDSNSAVDGCSKKSEPGYEHFEWLRIQLQFLRERGMKAILTGHVPPARTESKQSWDETCWQKYALWTQQYRDVIVGSVYGHMNIEHFMFQDFKDIKKKTRKGRGLRTQKEREALGDKITTQKKADYLTDLRIDWAQIPDPPSSKSSDGCISTYQREAEEYSEKREKYLEEIGGQWGERYSVSLVSASVVPNYFPTMRVVEYNTSGISTISDISMEDDEIDSRFDSPDQRPEQQNEREPGCFDFLSDDSNPSELKKKKKKHKRKFTVPKSPSAASPPGPAYSPQTFSWLSYTQYFANITKFNDNHARHHSSSPSSPANNNIFDQAMKSKLEPSFEYEIEYSTNNDSTWCLPDLTVRTYLDLARVIGRYQPPPDVDIDVGDADTDDEGDDDDVDTEKKGKKKKGKKHRKKERKDANRAWFTFLRRAFVGAVPDDELRDEFGVV